MSFLVAGRRKYSPRKGMIWWSILTPARAARRSDCRPAQATSWRALQTLSSLLMVTLSAVSTMARTVVCSCTSPPNLWMTRAMASQTCL
ncbi:hypothetical protein D3C85_1266450 [compost metagenome]